MLKKFKVSEILILIFTLFIIFLSEYHYLIEGDVDRAIFIGLWPPTIIGFLIFINLKLKQ
jgi:hypothetical protein